MNRLSNGYCCLGGASNLDEMCNRCQVFWREEINNPVKEHNFEQYQLVRMVNYEEDILTKSGWIGIVDHVGTSYNYLVVITTNLRIETVPKQGCWVVRDAEPSSIFRRFIEECAGRYGIRSTLQLE